MNTSNIQGQGQRNQQNSKNNLIINNGFIKQLIKNTKNQDLKNVNNTPIKGRTLSQHQNHHHHHYQHQHLNHTNFIVNHNINQKQNKNFNHIALLMQKNSNVQNYNQNQNQNYNSSKNSFNNPNTIKNINSNSNLNIINNNINNSQNYKHGYSKTSYNLPFHYNKKNNGNFNINFNQKIQYKQPLTPVYKGKTIVSSKSYHNNKEQNTQNKILIQSFKNYSISPSVSTISLKCANHLDRNAEFKIFIDDQTFLYCSKCAAHLASQGFQVQKLQEKGKQRIQIKNTQNQNLNLNQEQEQHPRKQELKQFLQNLRALQNTYRQKLQVLSQINQNYQQQKSNSHNLYHQMLSFLQNLKKQHLKQLQRQSIKNTQICQIQLGQIEQTLEEIFVMKDDIQFNINSIVQQVEEDKYRQCIDYYNQKVGLYEHRLEELGQDVGFPECIDQDQLYQKLEMFKQFVQQLMNKNGKINNGKGRLQTMMSLNMIVSNKNNNKDQKSLSSSSSKQKDRERQQQALPVSSKSIKGSFINQVLQLQSQRQESQLQDQDQEQDQQYQYSSQDQLDKKPIFQRQNKRDILNEIDEDNNGNISMRFY